MSFRTGDFPVTADGRSVGSVNIAQNGLNLVFDCICNYKSHDIVRLAAVCGDKFVPLGVMMPSSGGQDTGSHNLRFKKSFSKNALMAIGYDEADSFLLIRSGGVNAVVLPAYEAEPVVYNDFPDPVEYEYDFESEPEPVSNVPECVLQVADVEPAALEAEPVPELSEFPQMTSSAVNGWMTISNPGTLFNDLSVQEFCSDISNALIAEQDGYVLLAIPVTPNEPFPLMPVFCFGSSGDVGGQACIIFKVRNGNLTL